MLSHHVKRRKIATLFDIVTCSSHRAQFQFSITAAALIQSMPITKIVTKLSYSGTKFCPIKRLLLFDPFSLILEFKFIFLKNGPMHDARWTITIFVCKISKKSYENSPRYSLPDVQPDERNRF